MLIVRSSGNVHHPRAFTSLRFLFETVHQRLVAERKDDVEKGMRGTKKEEEGRKEGIDSKYDALLQ